MAVDRIDPAHAVPGEAHHTPSAYFDLGYRAFQLAQETMGDAIERFFTVGGRSVRLVFAGPALLPCIVPALAHLAAGPDPAPKLTVCLWDTDSTGINMPPPPWQAEDHRSRGEVHGYNDGRISTTFQADIGALSMYDRARDLALFWVPGASEVPYYERGAPLRTIFHWWASGQGSQMVHAAAVGTAEGGALLAGKGGSGKSTTALACLHAGLGYAGDDYVLLSTEGAPFAYSIYNSAKLNDDSMAHFPGLASAISNTGRSADEKALLFAHELFPHRIVTGMPVNVVLLPYVSGSGDTEPRLTRVSPALSLAALGPSTVLQLPGAGNEAFQHMARLVKQVPSYRLELGTDLTRIAEVITDLLAGDPTLTS